MDERQKMTPRGKSRNALWWGAATTGIFLAAASSYFYFSPSGRDFFQNARAALVQSIGDTFGGGAGGAFSSEISLDGDDASSSAQFFGASDVSGGADGADDGAVGADPSAQTRTTAPAAAVPSGVAMQNENGTGGSIAKAATENSSAENDISDGDVLGDPSGALSDNDAGQISAPPVSAPVAIPDCKIANAGNPSEKIILNEIAWMGSVPAEEETASHASDREWIELKNNSDAPVDLAGWQILDSAGDLKIPFGAGDRIAAGSFFFLARTADDFFTVPVDKTYSGSLPNAGDSLALFDPQCATVDMLDAFAAWPGGNNTTKQTLERDADGVGWHTSVAPGGTPRAENSLPPATPPGAPTAPPAPVLTPTSATPAELAAASSTSSTTTTTIFYGVSVAIEGDRAGAVSSDPAGIECGAECSAQYASGTILTLTAVPGVGDAFGGWSGACVGTGACSFSVNGTTSVEANFNVVGTDDPSVSSLVVPLAQPSVAGSPDHPVIMTVQIAGASSSNDFVKIFNPTAASIDMSGWKLHKKSSSGADYSLRTFPEGSVVAPEENFTWANSENSFSESIQADASSTETLSSDNSVALFDTSGAIIDQVAWGTGVGQYVEASAYPTNPAAGQTLVRKIQNGAPVDTDDNADDFAFQ